ncbi:MAG: type III secretion system chaperone [Succinivibrio sp.]
MGPDTSLRLMEELLKANLPWELPEPCRLSMDAEGRVWLSRTFTQQEQDAPDFAAQLDKFLAIVADHLSKLRAMAEAARRDNPFDGTGGLYS